MKDDDNQELNPGDDFEFAGQVDESIDAELEEDNVLYAGEYIVYVPPGQRATVRYELALDANSDVFNVNKGE